MITIKKFWTPSWLMNIEGLVRKLSQLATERCELRQDH
jgi:hypothetical protein